MLTLPAKIVIDPAEYAAGLKEAEAFHGHLCFGMYNGVKMALAARAALGLARFPHRDLISVVEIDRCLADAVMCITGCRLGRRTLRLKLWGRFAATFGLLGSGEGVRIVQQGPALDAIDAELERLGIDSHDRDKAGPVIGGWPVAEHFKLAVVPFDLPENERPGKPKVIVSCSRCGETVMDGHHREIGGQPVCQPCAAVGVAG